MACPPPPTRHSAPTGAAPHRRCAAPSPRVSPSPRSTDWCAAASPSRYLKGADLAAEWFVQQQYNDIKNISSKKYARGLGAKQLEVQRLSWSKFKSLVSCEKM
ncbi:hypothetical protein ACQJBY_038355 [Aegilops geniculata]